MSKITIEMEKQNNFHGHLEHGENTRPSETDYRDGTEPVNPPNSAKYPGN